MRTENLAIVFTDIKGYTAATAAQTHGENARMLAGVERAIAPLVGAYGGRVVKSIGDAYMMVFRSPTEAVRCAMAIQDRVHQLAAARHHGPAVQLRIAVNVGEVRVHRGDLFGEPVNVAARIETVTPAGEIYFSEAVHLTMNRTQVPGELVGDFELKGIPQPITVYRARPFAQGDGSSPPGPPAAGAAARLPFGGGELVHWRRMRRLRAAYLALWVLAVAGVGGAAYLRYRPAADFSAVLAQAREAVEQGKPVDAIALLGQIPRSATQERYLGRRLRHQAVAQLLDAGHLDMAGAELSALLEEDPRDAEALLMRGTLLARGGRDPRAAVLAIAQALRLSPALAARQEIAAAIVPGYRDPAARRAADQVVANHLKQAAVPALAAALADPSYDHRAHTALAARLEKLGAGQDVDWVALALEDLKASSCKTRLGAIARLAAEADERAVGPLLRVAGARGCGAAQARKAVDAILGK